MKNPVLHIFFSMLTAISLQLFSCGKQGGKQTSGKKSISASTSDVDTKKNPQQLPQIPVPVGPTTPPSQDNPPSASIPQSKLSWNGADFVGTSKLNIFPVE